jgi:hypothetical protein
MNKQLLISKKNDKYQYDIHIKTIKEEILEAITEIIMENILNMVNQNIQDALKKFQDT